MRTVVVCGNSLLALGVAASLEQRPEIRVVRLDPALPDDLESLQSLSPDAVVFDFSTARAEMFTGFLRGHPGLPLIGLDAVSGALLLLSGQQYDAVTTESLVSLIEAGDSLAGRHA